MTHVSTGFVKSKRCNGASCSAGGPLASLLRSWAAMLVLCATLGLGATIIAWPAHAHRKKITLDDLVIEGNIQKPEAFFILPRTNLNFADLERRGDLKSRILKSTEQAPF
jgi:hypothetical protein